jgi:hypothetical protein
MSLAMWLALGSDTNLIVGVLMVRVVTILKMLKDIRRYLYYISKIRLL